MKRMNRKEIKQNFVYIIIKKLMLFINEMKLFSNFILNIMIIGVIIGGKH